MTLLTISEIYDGKSTKYKTIILFLYYMIPKSQKQVATILYV
jgi:hypothetical protein